MDNRDPRVLTQFMHCLTFLENNLYLLYKDLADKVEMPLVKSLMLEISLDSRKHSILFKGVADSMPKVDLKAKDCPKKIGETWNKVEAFRSEISAKETIPEESLSALSEKLAVLESMIGEEYYVFVQLKTLQLMAKEIKQLYNVDLESNLQKIFAKIISDEEHHREILQRIRELIESKTQKDADNAPKVSFQNPDSWRRQLPTNY